MKSLMYSMLGVVLGILLLYACSLGCIFIMNLTVRFAAKSWVALVVFSVIFPLFSLIAKYISNIVAYLCARLLSYKRYAAFILIPPTLFFIWNDSYVAWNICNRVGMNIWGWLILIYCIFQISILFCKVIYNMIVGSLFIYEKRKEDKILES
jgi:hypothetical protein